MNKFLFTILVCLATALNCHSTNSQGTPLNEADSLIEVTLEEIPENPNKVKLAFKNISPQNIILFSQFKNFQDQQPFAPGLRVLFYRNQTLIASANWDENAKKNYCLEEGKVTIKPNTSVSIDLDVPQYEVYEDSEIGVEVEIRYRYKLENDDQLYNRLVKTEYIQIR